MKVIKLKPIRKAKAREMYRDYVKACQKFPGMDHYRRMRDVLREIKNGKKIICLSESIMAGGLNDKGEPRLAIARLSWEFCRCVRYQNGRIYFTGHRRWRNRPISITGNLFPGQKDSDLQTVIPPIPPHLLPKSKDRYYILWEVEDWSEVPRDPFLLRRIPRTDYYVIVAAWNLTKLERQIIKGAK